MKKRIFMLLLVILAALSAGCRREETTEIPTQTIAATEAPTAEYTETQPAETEAPETQPTETEPVETMPAGPVKVACVGDSITYGHGILNPNEDTYPAVLGSLLGEGYTVKNFGDPGSTVQKDGDQSYWRRMPYTRSLEFESDIVVFMMGTNDSKEYNWHSEEAFREDLEAMLDSYGSSTEIYLCTPASAFFLRGQDGPETGYNIRPAQVDTIAGMIRQVARDRQLPLIDIHALTAENPQWFAADGVHPDEAGAEAIALAVYEALIANP